MERRRKRAAFRDPNRTLDTFDFTFNPKINRILVFDLATCAFIGKREDALFLGPGGTGRSHLAQAIGQAAILQGYRVLYRETHVLLDNLADAVADGTRKEFMESLRDAQAAGDGGRRSNGDHHAPLRACQYTVDIEPPRLRLGEAVERCRLGSMCQARHPHPEKW